jgi:hypothetical protein
VIAGRPDLIIYAVFGSFTGMYGRAEYHRLRLNKSALASRDVIGQAKGMIMERLSVDAVGAFQMLTRLSQQTNTPVAVVATHIVARGSTSKPTLRQRRFRSNRG